MLVLNLHVVLDVIQKRLPHYAASAAVVDGVVRCKERGALPAHALTTIHFLVTPRVPLTKRLTGFCGISKLLRSASRDCLGPDLWDGLISRMQLLPQRQSLWRRLRS